MQRDERSRNVPLRAMRRLARIRLARTGVASKCSIGSGPLLGPCISTSWLTAYDRNAPILEIRNAGRFLFTRFLLVHAAVAIAGFVDATN